MLYKYYEKLYHFREWARWPTPASYEVAMLDNIIGSQVGHDLVTRDHSGYGGPCLNTITAAPEHEQSEGLGAPLIFI